MTISQCQYGELPPALVKRARLEGAYLDQTLKSPWTFFRAMFGEVTVGFVGVLCRTPSIVTLRGWWVAPRFRGQGVGTALLEAAVTYAFDQGASKVEIRTSQDRIAQRLGFEWTGYQRKGGNRERQFVRHAH